MYWLKSCWCVLIFVSFGCAAQPLMTDNHDPTQPAPYGTRLSESGSCRVEDMIVLDLFPGIKESDPKARNFYGVCTGTGYVYFNDSYVDFVENLNQGTLQSEVERIVHGYGKIFDRIEIRMKDQGDEKVWVGPSLDYALCYPYYDDGCGKVATPPVLRKVQVGFVEDPAGELGGPSYARLLLNRAVVLRDKDSVRKLIGIFERLGKLDRNGDRFTGNCALALNAAYARQIIDLLHEKKIQETKQFAREFCFLLVTEGSVESFERWSRGHYTNDLSGYARKEIAARLEYGITEDFLYAKDLAREFGMSQETLKDLVQKSLRAIFKQSFLERDLAPIAKNARLILKNFPLSENEVVQARLSGYADAGYGLMTGPCGPMGVCDHFNDIIPRISDLPHESRILIGSWLLTRYTTIDVEDLQEIHRYLRLASVRPPEVMEAMAIMVAVVSQYLYDSQEPGNEHLRDLAKTVVYAMDQMNFDPMEAYKADVCSMSDDEEMLRGVRFLRCGNGVEYCRTVALATRN